MSFSVPVDHKMKMRESENIDKYLNLTRVLKNLWNMNVSVTLIVVTFRIVLRSLKKQLEELEIRGRI